MVRKQLSTPFSFVSRSMELFRQLEVHFLAILDFIYDLFVVIGTIASPATILTLDILLTRALLFLLVPLYVYAIISICLKIVGSFSMALVAPVSIAWDLIVVAIFTSFALLIIILVFLVHFISLSVRLFLTPIGSWQVSGEMLCASLYHIDSKSARGKASDNEKFELRQERILNGLVYASDLIGIWAEKLLSAPGNAARGLKYLCTIGLKLNPSERLVCLMKAATTEMDITDANHAMPPSRSGQRGATNRSDVAGVLGNAVDTSSSKTRSKGLPLSDGETTKSQDLEHSEDNFRDRFIFLLAKGSTLRLHQFNAVLHDTSAFAQELRQAHRQLRGLFRHYFGLSVFSSCEFSKFERFCPSKYSYRGHGLPPDAGYHSADYFYQPRPAVNQPPISAEEFQHIYYHYAQPAIIIQTSGFLPVAVKTSKSNSVESITLNNDSRRKSRLWLPRLIAICHSPPVWDYFSKVRDGKLPSDTVSRIPQRFRPLDDEDPQREELWGLMIREERSAFRVAIYILLFQSPWLAFFFWYLFGSSDNKMDFQDAATPLTISLASVALFISWLVK
jgi:hypothetical protein